MKPTATSKPFFDHNQVQAALDAAPDRPVHDVDNPPSRPGEWDNAVVSHSLGELRGELGKRRGRGPNKHPTKQQVAIRLSPEVLDYFKAGGSGWQTRVDEALREYVDRHKAA